MVSIVQREKTRQNSVTESYGKFIKYTRCLANMRVNMENCVCNIWPSICELLLFV